MGLDACGVIGIKRRAMVCHWVGLEYAIYSPVMAERSDGLIVKGVNVNKVKSSRVVYYWGTCHSY